MRCDFYGIVNVKCAPCKSAAQLHSAADYILGKKKEKEDWFDYPRQEQDIEYSHQFMRDYSRWEADEEEDVNLPM